MTLRNLIRRASRYKGRLCLIAVLALLTSASMLAIPALAGALLGGAVSGADVGRAEIVLALLLALFLTTFFTLATSLATVATSARVLADLRKEVFDHLSHLPLAFHDNSRQGDLLALATYEVGRLSGFLTSTLAQVPAMLVTSAGASVALFLIDPALALIVPVLVPAFYIVLKLLARRLRKLAERAREAEADVFALAESHLHMLPATKAFASETAQQEIYAQAVEVARQRRVATDRASAAIGPVTGLLAACAAVFVILAADAQFASADMTPAELFSFLFYAALLTRPIGSLSNVYGQWQVAKGTLERLERVLAMPQEPGYAATQSLARARGAIRFDHVRFAYPGRKGPIHDANLAIEPGEVVALVGENGCGKTTLAKLLLRFYEVDGGRITLDDVDITALDVQDLRRQIGYVPQRALLFNGTVRENLIFGSRDSDPASIERALKLAQAHDFVASLPSGLATRIGDDGVRLSGGQRQRLALARTLLADPPVMVFDEATSMWDLEGEAAFVESCRAALAGRTVILITHRPASLALADRIIVVEKGCCRELNAAQRRALLASPAP